jgi:ParB-like chromosome segregation protein Spo0J
MKANIQTGNIQSVAISSLTAYPTNPRRGDIDAIASSLNAHGQYRPIVVQERALSLFSRVITHLKRQRN